MVEAARSKRFRLWKGGTAGASTLPSTMRAEDNPGSAGASPAVSRAPRDTLGAIAEPDCGAGRPDVFGEAPKTAGEEPALPGGNSLLVWLNFVCLDAPIVAVSWAWLFARGFGIPIPAGEAGALFLTAWLIYLADRFGDSLSVDPRGPTSARQRFCLRHRRAWTAVLLAVAAADLFVICISLNTRECVAGTVIGLCAVIYLSVNQLLPKIWRVLPMKEFSIGLLFAAGTMVPLSASLTRAVPPIWFLFACLCAMNCICIAFWERALDAAQQRISIATAFPRVARLVLPVLLLLCLTSVLFAVQPLFLCIAISAGLLAVLHVFGERLAPDSRTALADLIMLSPLFILGSAHL
ncbi:hypothetical protein BH18VER1_BH18VER1_16760 [soil metagenome]